MNLPNDIAPILRCFIPGCFAAAILLDPTASEAATLWIGYQKAASTLVLLKAHGTLEKKLAPLNVEVKWLEFAAGPQLLEGLNLGSIDFGYVGEVPPIFALAAGAPLVYTAYELPTPEAEMPDSSMVIFSPLIWLRQMHGPLFRTALSTPGRFGIRFSSPRKDKSVRGC
jgi:hypothetical protein